MNKIELLCPAKNVEIGKEAIKHGADAVFIGGPSLGARALAGNSVAEIQELCDYAHLFGARVYVTLNVILYDHELDYAEKMIHELYEAGVDALITQDLAVLKMNLPPIALHASTQMDNCTLQKARFLEKAGYSQIVVARELSLDQIAAIHEVTKVPIEAFVHGALCVSYSGRCYVSQYCSGRSANRGECSQFCRLSFDLVDADGEVIAKAHHLSMKDLNRSNSLEQMMDAGVRSFKVEGRLKDVHYVKNITAYYRRRIDAILEKRQDYVRASYGQSRYAFLPDVKKSFNRGFTDFFLEGRKPDIWSLKTPKAIGTFVGRVKKVGRKSFWVDGEEAFANGDGFCFFNDEGKLQGFRINRAEGNELFPAQLPPELELGVELYRNEDRYFERTLERSQSERVLGLRIELCEQQIPEGYLLRATTESGASIEIFFDCLLQEARSSQKDNIVRQLSKLGGTVFYAQEVKVHCTREPFIPSSLLSEWRRTMVQTLEAHLRSTHQRDLRRPIAEDLSLEGVPTDYTANIANRLAREFLEEHGASQVMPAYEIAPIAGASLMTCKHCLRYAHGQCPRQTGRKPTWREPLALRMSNGKMFPLTFDCRKCEMHVHHR